MRRKLIHGGVYFIALTGWQFVVYELPTPRNGVTHVLKPRYPTQGLPASVIIGGLINGQHGQLADDMLDFTGKVVVSGSSTEGTTNQGQDTRT